MALSSVDNHRNPRPLQPAGRGRGVIDRTPRQDDTRATPLGLPALLTVEEAAVLLRIGRTKAYAMATEWRQTDGRTGLPVVDFGNVLRVPLAALEDMIGATLAPRTSPEPTPTGQPATQGSRSDTPARGRRRAGGVSGQLGLFGQPA